MTKIIEWQYIFKKERNKDLILEDYLDLEKGKWLERNISFYNLKNVDRLIKWKPDEKYNYFTILNKNGYWALYRSKSNGPN